MGAFCSIGVPICWPSPNAIEVFEKKHKKEIRVGQSMMKDIGVISPDVLRFTIEPNPESEKSDIRSFNPYQSDIVNNTTSRPLREPRSVRLHIAQTFPDDESKYGRMVISVIVGSQTYKDRCSSIMKDNDSIHIEDLKHNTPLIVPCKGRKYRDVSREVNIHVKQAHAESRKCIICIVYDAPKSKRVSKRASGSYGITHMSYGRDQSSACGMGRQIFFVTPTDKLSARAVRNIVIAWGISVQGVSQECIRHVPVVWRKTSTGHRMPPRFRERKCGYVDEAECATDYSEASTSPSAVEEKDYDALQSAPLPKDGQITTPSRSMPGQTSVRAVRSVDIHLFHPLVEEWVENCLVDVSEIGTNGMNVTRSLDLLPYPSTLIRKQTRHRYSTDRLSPIPGAIPVDISVHEASLESEEQRHRPLKISGKRAIVQREAKSRYINQRLRQFNRTKRIRHAHLPKHKERMDESRPDPLYYDSNAPTVANRAIASLRKQYDDADDGMNHSLAMEKIILERIFHKFLEEYAAEEKKGLQRKYVQKLLHEASTSSRPSEDSTRSEEDLASEHDYDDDKKEEIDVNE